MVSVGKFFLITPLLFSLYPIFFLYSGNAEELVLKQLILPAEIALTFSLFLTLLLYALIRDVGKTIIVSIGIIFVCFNYGTIYDIIALEYGFKHRHFLPFIFFILGYLLFFLFKFSSNQVTSSLAKAMSGVILLLSVLNIVLALPTEIKKIRVGSESKKEETAFKVNQNYQDIYYIVLDEYASLDTIKSIWGYDNKSFTEFLSQKGFYIADKSKSRYNLTLWSLASTLNLDYVSDKVSNQEFFNSTYKKTEKNEKLAKISDADLIQKINKNKVSFDLKEKGYKIITLESGALFYQSLAWKNADVNYFYDDKDVNLVDEFSMMLIRKSILNPFDYIVKSSSALNNKYYNTNLYYFNQLRETVKINGPKFIYAHIMCPHTPFVFDKNGNKIDDINMKNWKEKKYYLDQYIYVSKEIEKTLNHITNNSTNKPIIIIQSDHGPRPLNSSPEQNIDIPVEDMFKIFNAVYFPDEDYKLLYNNISPPNTFRVLFNKYFNQKMKLLEDE